MAEVILGIGGNSGDRLQNLMLAGGHLYNKLGRISAYSEIIQSEPWGFKSERTFLNQVIVLKTEANPMQVLEICQEIENLMGRERTSSYTDRTMDIDILFYDDQVISEDRLIVPHPRLHKRLFVLKPLASICPKLVHPVLSKTIKELLDSCDDDSETRWFKGNYSLPIPF